MEPNSTKQPGILELLSRGDADAAATVLQLVRSKSLKPGQFTSIFMAAATGMAKAKDGAHAETFEFLVRTSAWKMPAETVHHVKWEFILALSNPDGAPVERLESLATWAAVLMEQRLAAKCHLIDVAEALADGFGKTRDSARIAVMEKKVANHLARKLPSDLQRIYESVFELATLPSSSEECVFNVILTAYAQRARRGAVALEPVVIQRIERALEPQNKAKAAKCGPLSDGDMGLPNPMARKRPIVHTITKIAKQLVGSRASAQPQQ